MTSEIMKNRTAKILEEKTNICIEEPGKESGNKLFDLEYYLLEGSYEGTEEELNGTRVYGIEVVKKMMDEVMEKETIMDFSSDKARTMKALKLLKESKVTPVTFKEILEDIMAE